MMNGFVGEFFGTAVMVIFGAGTGAEVNLQKTNGHGANWFMVCLSWGMAVAFGAYVGGALGSLGHLNPALTVPYAICGLFPWKNVVPYLCGQFLGAFVGAIIVILHYWPHFKATKTLEEGNTVGIFATLPAISSPFWNFLSEVIATFSLAFVLLHMGAKIADGLTPLLVGFLIFVVGVALGGTTGFAMNPARDWGPRLAYTILPVPNKTSARWDYAWVPMVGPLVGGLLAAALTKAI